MGSLVLSIENDDPVEKMNGTLDWNRYVSTQLLLASESLSGTINLIVRATRFGLVMRSTIPANLKKSAPVIVGGLASIPLIIYQINDFVDAA